MKLWKVLPFVLLCSPALAQQQQSPEVQALGAKLLFEINRGVSCDAGMITANARIAELEKQVAELKKEK